MPKMYRVWTYSKGLYARVPEDTEDSISTVCYVAVRFEELAIFILTLSVSWVSACGLVGGYRSHATRGESSLAPAARHKPDYTPPLLPCSVALCSKLKACTVFCSECKALNRDAGCLQTFPQH